MNFGESVFSAGFNQKTVKGDLFVKGNHGIPPRDQRGKVPEDYRRLSTEAGLDPLTCGGRPAPPRGFPAHVGPTCHPLCYVGSPLPPRMHLSRYFKSV